MTDLPAESSAVAPLTGPEGSSDEPQRLAVERESSAGVPVGEIGEAAPAIVDVWSRTEPKYRTRAIALLFLNFCLFCGLCVFTHWLHVARPFDFSWESYVAPARVWGRETQNLNDFVLYPISVIRTPMHAIVLGLLMASTVAVPIVVAILYRFPSALPFIAAVAAFAHLPWMAVTLLGSCILAAVPPFRMQFRYGSALVAMLPVLLYLYLATRGTPDQAALYASPAERSLLAAPWVLAILAACAMMATVLLISRAVNYRPGAVAPVVAVMFVIPVALFHLAVGVDELYYRILEVQYGPRSERFEPVHDARPEIRELLFEVDPPLYNQFFMEAWSGERDSFKQAVWYGMLVRFLSQRAEAFDACKYFLIDHPESRYVPNVLYMQARILDTRLDERKLIATEGPPTRELYTDFPHVQSEVPWRQLVDHYPDSPLVLAGGVRLAQLHLRRGEIDEAVTRLQQVKARAKALVDASAATQPARGLLDPAPPESSLRFEPEPYVVEADRLLELIRANRDDPQFGDQPLVDLAGLDSHRPAYEQQLLSLARRYEGGLLYDNLLVVWANALPEGRQAEMLDQIVRSFPEGDARAEALFRLARLELQAGMSGDAERGARGLGRLRELVQRYADTSWGRLATQRLAGLEARSPETVAGS